jgi:hypothetical protein
MRKNKNYYQILDIAPGANQNEIFHAYSRAKRTYTTDSLASYSLLDTSTSDEMMKEIEEAYQVLGNSSRRKEYDNSMGFQSWSMTEEFEQHEAQVKKSAASSHDSSSDSNLLSSTSEALRLAKQITDSSAAEAPAPKVEIQKAVDPEPHIIRPVFTQATVRTSNQFVPNPEFEDKIQNADSVDGAFIRAVRVYRQMSEAEIAARCKLSVSQVTAIEEEAAHQMTETVYLRGHVALIAREIGFPDPYRAAQLYIQKLRDDGKLAKPTFGR